MTRLWVVAALFLVMLCQAAEARHRSVPIPIPSTNSLLPQTQQFISRLATQPTQTRQNIYNQQIGILVNSGIWQTMDACYDFAASDAATAGTNLVSSAGAITVHGSPTFSADHGYTGTGTTADYLETGLNPSTDGGNFALTNASVSAWRSTSPAGDGGLIVGDATDDNSFIWLPATGNDQSVNFVFNPISSTLVTATGLFASSLVSGAETPYINGVAIQGAITRTPTMDNATMRFVGDGGSTTTSQISGGCFGAGLTAEGNRNLYGAYSGYLNAIAGATFPWLFLSSDIVNNGANNFDGAIVRLQDGRLLAIYHVCTGGQLSCNISYQTSTTGAPGSWSAASVAATPPASNGYYGAHAVVTSGGTIVVSLYLDANDGSAFSVYTMTGTTSGGAITWSSPAAVSGIGQTNTATEGPVLILANGTWMLPWYDGTNDAGVIFSTNQGTSWSSPITVASTTYTEATYVQLSTGQIVGVLRKEATGYYEVTSNDNGATWSAPSLILSYSNPGDPQLTVAGNDELLLMVRYTNDFPYYMWYKGGSWSSPVPYNSFNSPAATGQKDAYVGGFYDKQTSDFMYVISQGTFSNANVEFQQFSVP